MHPFTLDEGQTRAENRGRWSTRYIDVPNERTANVPRRSRKFDVTLRRGWRAAWGSISIKSCWTSRRYVRARRSWPRI